MMSSHVDELLNYMQEHAGAEAQRQSSFMAAYFENADPDEMAARGPAALYAIANAHWRLLDAPHAAQSARLRVYNPTLSEDGFVSEHTVAGFPIIDI